MNSLVKPISLVLLIFFVSLFVAAPSTGIVADDQDIPQILSLTASPTLIRGAYANWKFVIEGKHFGEQEAFEGTNPHIWVVDITSDGWVAGSSGCSVGVKVSSWTDNKIVIDRYTGAYNISSYMAKVGDVIQIHISNPTNAHQSNNFDVTLQASDKQPAEAEVGNPFNASNYRKQLLHAIDQKIKSTTDLLDDIPQARRADSSTQATLDRMNQERQSLLALTDDELAARYKQDQAKIEEADARNSTNTNSEMTFDLKKGGPQTKYPDWSGPWKTCPLCAGTGHSHASQRKTMQDLSPEIAAIAGTGMSGTIKNAISYCELCGGTGRIPDVGQ